MSIAHLLQTDTANSSVIIDTLFDNNIPFTPVSLEDDLNVIRSLLKRLVGNNSWTDLTNTISLVDITNYINEYDNKILKLESEVSILYERDYFSAQNLYMLDFGELNLYNFSGNINDDFLNLITNFVQKSHNDNYKLDAIVVPFPIEKLTTQDLNKLVLVIKEFKKFLAQQKLGNIKFGIYINLFNVIPENTFTALSLLTSGFTSRLPSFFTDEQASYLDLLILGPIDDISIYSYDSTSSTYTYLNVQDPGGFGINYLDFIDSVFFNSLRHLEIKKTHVIFSVKNPDFFYKNSEKLSTMSNRRALMMPSTYLYPAPVATQYNIDYYFNLQYEKFNIYVFDSLIDQSNCPGIYLTPYAESQLCAFQNKDRYNNLGTNFINGAIGSDGIPVDVFNYYSNSLKLKNKLKVNTAGILVRTNNNETKVFYESATINFIVDRTGNDPSYSVQLNQYKKLQIDGIERWYKEVLTKEELDEAFDITLASSSLVIHPGTEFKRNFVTYSKNSASEPARIYIGLDFNDFFTLELYNGGVFDKDLTYTNIFSAQFTPTGYDTGTFTFVSGTNSLIIDNVSFGFHVFNFFVSGDGNLYIDLDFRTEEFDFIEPFSLAFGFPVFPINNSYLLRISNLSSLNPIRISNIIHITEGAGGLATM